MAPVAIDYGVPYSDGPDVTNVVNVDVGPQLDVPADWTADAYAMPTDQPDQEQQAPGIPSFVLQDAGWTAGFPFMPPVVPVFANVPPGYVAGTVAGMHTVAELKELVNAKDAELQALTTSAARLIPQWIAQDSVAASDWNSDFAALQQRYKLARIAAVTLPPVSVTPDTIAAITPAEPQWNAILSSLKQNATTVTKGDLVDLVGRLHDATGQALDMPKFAQPVATDADLAAFNAAGKAQQAASAAASAASSAAGSVFSAGNLLIVGAVVGIAGVLLLKK